MSGPCVVCGQAATRGHHLTGRGPAEQYLDPELVVPTCHDHHELLHDDWRALKLEKIEERLTFFERWELRLRRLAAFAARQAEAHPDRWLWRSLATCLTRWADELARGLRRLDERDPDWRSDPGFYPEGGTPA